MTFQGLTILGTCEKIFKLEIGFLVLSITALIFAVLAFAASIYNFIQYEAMKRSTHQVTFVDPNKQSFEDLNDELKKKLLDNDLGAI